AQLATQCSSTASAAAAGPDQVKKPATMAPAGRGSKNRNAFMIVVDPFQERPPLWTPLSISPSLFANSRRSRSFLNQRVSKLGSKNSRGLQGWLCRRTEISRLHLAAMDDHLLQDDSRIDHPDLHRMHSRIIDPVNRVKAAGIVPHPVAPVSDRRGAGM